MSCKNIICGYKMAGKIELASFIGLFSYLLYAYDITVLL